MLRLYLMKILFYFIVFYFFLFLFYISWVAITPRYTDKMQSTDKMKSSEFLSNVREVKTDANPARAQSYALDNFFENETGIQ